MASSGPAKPPDAEPAMAAPRAGCAPVWSLAAILPVPDQPFRPKKFIEPIGAQLQRAILRFPHDFQAVPCKKPAEQSGLSTRTKIPAIRAGGIETGPPGNTRTLDDPVNTARSGRENETRSTIYR